MAKYSSKDVAFILIDGFNVIGVSTQLSDGKEAVLEDTMALGDTWPEPEDTGLRKGEWQTEGFFDDATGSISDALASSVGVSRVVCYGVEGNAVGQDFVGLEGAFVGKYQRTANLGGFHRAKGEYAVSGQVDEGIILHELSAETADGDTEGGDSQDNGSSSAAGGVGYLQLTALALDTATNLIVKIRDSSDDITYGDLIAFTAETAAPSAQRSTVAGTVERHLASSWAWTGGAGGSSSATFMVGFARG